MIPRIIVASIVVALIAISVSIVFSQQQFESENEFQVYKEEFKDVEWNNEIIKILPREELEIEWTLLWSDGAEEFVYGDKKEIKNELLFSECTKKDYRIRVNLVEGEYNQDVIKELVFLNNLVVGKI